jgi:hypothetical protein
MIDAIAAARSAVSGMTGQQIDSIAKCFRLENGSWAISVDVIESLARMGDNDLLATYDVEISTTAELVSYARLRRYHREDQDS